MKLYRRLLRYVRPHRLVFVAAVAGMLLAASTDVILFQIVRPALNNIGAITPAQTAWLPAMIVGVFVLRGIGSYASEYGLAWIGSRVVFDLRREASEHLLRLPTPFYDASSAGRLLSKITYDAQQIATTASEAITVSIRNTLTIAIMLGYLLYLNWQLTVIAFAALPLVGFTIRKINRRIKRVSVMVQERTGNLTHVLEEAIGAHRVVKVFGGEHYEGERLREAANKLRLATAKQAAAAALGTPINQIILSVAVGAIVWFAVRQNAAGTYGAGDFIVYVVALLHLLNTLKALTNVTGTIQRGLTAAESVFALIDEPAEADTGTVTLGRARGGIRIEHVTKRYHPDAPLGARRRRSRRSHRASRWRWSDRRAAARRRSSISFRASTRRRRGRILLDGVDLAEIRLADLRRQIALVSQDIVLFNDTIAANIAYGAMAGASQQEIERAARGGQRGRLHPRAAERLRHASSASAASGSRAASASASRSRARSSRTRRS